MSKSNDSERRKHDRFATEIDICYRVNYDIKTKVEFTLLKDKDSAIKKFFGISKNISADGLSFETHKQLNEQDHLYLEVYVPKSAEPVKMTGEVRWSTCSNNGEEPSYNTGVRILTVEREEVAPSIGFDETYHVVWSTLLESVIGKYRILAQKKDKEL